MGARATGEARSDGVSKSKGHACQDAGVRCSPHGAARIVACFDTPSLPAMSVAQCSVDRYALLLSAWMRVFSVSNGCPTTAMLPPATPPASHGRHSIPWRAGIARCGVRRSGVVCWVVIYRALSGYSTDPVAADEAGPLLGSAPGAKYTLVLVRGSACSLPSRPNPEQKTAWEASRAGRTNERRMDPTQDAQRRPPRPAPSWPSRWCPQRKEGTLCGMGLGECGSQWGCRHR